jgi:hypothetical protein
MKKTTIQGHEEFFYSSMSLDSNTLQETMLAMGGMRFCGDLNTKKMFKLEIT